ncbi:MAG: 4-hydroxy-tetrahydrodipicolinate reductase, partial [Gammaproteobacteria bacterium]|nr:4-hydroxy-tetrahydrodipicolinate reductase [Gammaproteobacteria bacterium]
MKNETIITVTGAAGRMGRSLIEAVQEEPSATLAAALEHSESSALGMDAGELAGVGKAGVTIDSDPLAALSRADVLIDFTRPAVTLANIEWCRQSGTKMVIGTTGFSDEEKAVIAEASREIAIVFAPNMSVGVNLCFKLLD